MAETLRLDKWLWHARFCKTRGGAQRVCEAGAADLNGGTVVKPAQKVQAGDRLTLRLGRWIVSVEVLALGSRRGPAPEARLLYRELSRERLVQPVAEESLFDLEALADF